MVLEAIRYSRGSLQLLEQRQLPLETTWVTISNVQKGWAAIRDMTVRGAPAIAIAAALSLAVELVHGGGGSQFASAAEAAAHIVKQLDYLASSRPTAVNLFDAIRKLTRVANEAAAAPAAGPAAVIESVVQAAEAMLEEDVAANRAMGGYGAHALLAAAQARGRAASGQLRVLTHCNTGSLATAAFGTALGVVRALHEQGRLEHAYCTETRPYNQGARLTAYELVHDGLPATLLCDSAAAALMAGGNVDAVVVGADRVAANGDTANKIGTFSLAVAAAYHDIPFFIAAPTTTLDPQLQDGTLIPIEQRDPREITHFKGVRVAAEINVWNPSFDVTPARLIEGIITEKGLVPKPAAKGAFSIRPWLREIGLLAEPQGETDGTGAAPSLPTAAGFSQLDVDSVKRYVAARPQLAKHVGAPSTALDWAVREVGDGNLNFVFIVEGPDGGVCIKQAPPYVRCVGEAWPLAQDRVRIEAAALAEEAHHCPAHVPTLYHFDGPMCLLAMQYVPPAHIILRRGLIEGRIYPQVAGHLATLLAQTLFHTSLLALPSDKFRELAVKFTNTEMCRLTEQVIFTDPFYAAQYNRHTAPQLDVDAAALHDDEEAKTAAAALKAKFTERAQALIHGDLHTGSVMVTQDSTYAIDPEFAFVGPMAFDIAKVVANLLLAFFAADGHASAANPRTEQRRWLLKAVEEVWEGFKTAFLELWEQHEPAGDAYPAALFGNAAAGGPAARHLAQRAFLDELWADAVGFAGIVMIRRLVGIAHVADMDSIEDADARAVCERRALRFGRRLLVQGAEECAGGVALLTEAADAARADGARPHFEL